MNKRSLREKYSGLNGENIERECNLCEKFFLAENKFIRFCDSCRNSNKKIKNYDTLEPYEIGTMNQHKAKSK